MMVKKHFSLKIAKLSIYNHLYYFVDESWYKKLYMQSLLQFLKLSKNYWSIISIL